MKIVTKEVIDKGWSHDQKYRVTDEAGTPYLLRVSDMAKFDAKETEFRMMEKIAALGVPMSQPVEFGTCEEGVYSIQSWIDGEELEQVLPRCSDTEQYVYGLESGRILRKIHSVPAPEGTEDWEPRFNRKMDRKIETYLKSPLKCEGGEAFITYCHEHRHLLKDRPQVYQHGDYHVGNMMVDRAGQLTIIDFDRGDFGDPWEEFNRIVWCAQKSPLFASGMVNGYFDGEVPMAFWELLALYIASNALSSVYWAIPYGEKEIEIILEQTRDILSWYDHMRRVVPSWYFEGYYLQSLDGIPFKLREAYDFSFMREFGTVFRVFDDQDSGNICFGTEKDGERYFVKFAGAPTEQYEGDPADAITRLKEALPVYRDLKHEHLIEFVEGREIGGGFALVFRWADGVSMGRMCPAAHRRFLALPLRARLEVFQDILSFFDYVAAENYVAIDFYDGSILYDFETGTTTICDIDFFRKQPCVNDMGRIWGSSLFQAPEEYQLGATLDEVTNVYTLGATAFALFGGYERSREKWELSDELFGVASRAVREDRWERQPSIREFRAEWDAASK